MESQTNDRLTNDRATSDRLTNDPERTEARAGHLLPEERAVGSDDPRAQAEAILDDSDVREHQPNGAPDTFLERRTSADTVTPAPGDDTAPLEPPD